MKNSWNLMGNKVFPLNIETLKNKLPKGIWLYKFHPDMGPYLEMIGDKFQLPKSLLKSREEEKLRILKDWDVQSKRGKNLGVLFEGKKGSGKTMDAKALANATDLPVILFTFSHPNIKDFLANLTESVVCLFDEFDKTFNPEDKDSKKDSDSLLTVLDGVSAGDISKLFIFTVNDMEKVNQYMIGRPSRIKYRLKYNPLTYEELEAILQSQLKGKAKEVESEVLDYLSNVNEVTIDLVMSIVNDVNDTGIFDDISRSIYNVDTIPKEGGIVLNLRNSAYPAIIMNRDRNELPLTRYTKYQAERVEKFAGFPTRLAHLSLELDPYGKGFSLPSVLKMQKPIISGSDKVGYLKDTGELVEITTNEAVVIYRDNLILPDGTRNPNPFEMVRILSVNGCGKKLTKVGAIHELELELHTDSLLIRSSEIGNVITLDGDVQKGTHPFSKRPNSTFEYEYQTSDLVDDIKGVDLYTLNELLELKTSPTKVFIEIKAIESRVF